MKKSSSENFISKNPFTAKPPLCLSAMELRLGRSRGPGQSCSLPTSPLSDPGNFRSHSSSPGRHTSPDCVKLKLVSAGSSFCLVKDEPQIKPNDDINGRKSPFISTRTWPKALRTRSASKEKISSKHGILYGSVEQIKAFQEKKAPAVENFTSTLPLNPEKRKEDVNYPVRRSTSVLQIPPTEKVGEKQRPKGILKSSVSVPRVQERILSYQNSIEETQSKRQSALPWATKLVPPEVCQKSTLRKTASSPCLFVKKNSVKIKTQKAPIKLFGTITTLSNLIGESLPHVRETKSEQDEILQEAPVCSATSRGNSLEEYQIKIPQISNVRNQSTNTREARPNNNKMSKHFHSTFESNKTQLAMENQSNGLSHISQNNNLSQSNIQPVNSEKTIRYREPPPPPTNDQDPDTEIKSPPWTEPVSDLGTETGSEGTETDTWDKQRERERPNITSSSLTLLHENLDCFEPRRERRESQVCVTYNEDSRRLAGEECNITVTSPPSAPSPQQKLNEEQRNIYDSEPVNGVNSSEDEEIQKELTSILPNGRDKPELPKLVRPRFVTKPSRHCDQISERISDSSDISNVSGDEPPKTEEIKEVSSSGSVSTQPVTVGSHRGKSACTYYM